MLIYPILGDLGIALQVPSTTAAYFVKCFEAKPVKAATPEEGKKEYVVDSRQHESADTFVVVCFQLDREKMLAGTKTYEAQIEEFKRRARGNTLEVVPRAASLMLTRYGCDLPMRKEAKPDGQGIVKYLLRQTADGFVSTSDEVMLQGYELLLS